MLEMYRLLLLEKWLRSYWSVWICVLSFIRICYEIEKYFRSLFIEIKIY